MKEQAKRVFVAGASGVIGRSLIPRLIEQGHTVTAMTRSTQSAERLAATGARPVVCDVYDTSSLEKVMRQAAPEVILHQLTALPPAIDPRKLDGLAVGKPHSPRVATTRSPSPGW